VTWTQADVRAIMARRGQSGPLPADVRHSTSGLARMPRGEMNKLEASYAQHLEVLKRAGIIVWYGYEAITLRLAKRTRYTPDFTVVTAEGRVEFHETKGGYWRDDARVKIKVAAEMYPWARFVGITARRERDGGGWAEEEF
jgi:hypothetical protein